MDRQLVLFWCAIFAVPLVCGALAYLSTGGGWLVRAAMWIWGGMLLGTMLIWDSSGWSLLFFLPIVASVLASVVAVLFGLAQARQRAG